jgi:hypothetical protein
MITVLGPMITVRARWVVIAGQDSSAIGWTMPIARWLELHAVRCRDLAHRPDKGKQSLPTSGHCGVGLSAKLRPQAIRHGCFIRSA